MNPILDSLINVFSIAVSESTSSVFQNTTTSLASNIDPNWFYSSSAQCAAAIVGLIGAFLITKLIQKKTYEAQLINEIVDNKKKIKSIKDEISTIEEYVKKVEEKKLVDDFLNFIIYEINLDSPQDLDYIYDIALKEKKYININKGILKKEYNDEYLNRARRESEMLINEFLFMIDNNGIYDEFLKEASPKSIDLMNTLILFMRADRLGGYYNSADEVFMRIKEIIKDTKYEPIIKKEVLFKKMYNDFLKDQDFSKKVTFKKLGPSTSAANEIHKQYEMINIKNKEMEYYEQDLMIKSSLIIYSQSDIKMKNTFLLLFIFSLIGVFLPLFTMLFDYDTMLRYRTVCFCIILLGWLLLLANFYYEIWISKT